LDVIVFIRSSAENVNIFGSDVIYGFSVPLSL